MTRRFGHWTSQYIRDRILQKLYFRRNPDVPWLSPQANHLLATLLRPTDIGVEFGSGRSTAWFARRIQQLVSIEHDPTWYGIVREDIARASLHNVEYVLASIREDEDPATSEYVRVADRFADRTLDFVLVDGMARDQCALALLPKVAPGGLMVVDDIHGFLDFETTAPYARWRRGPANDAWARFASEVSGWRWIVAAQGIKDTGIWIRPA
jgi:predicted O-methyltransferase YrrM